MLGGFLVPLAGANFVFALNAACFLLVVQATHQWKPPAVPAKLPTESFFESFRTAIHYIRYAPGFQVVLARNFRFALFIFSDSGIDAGCGLSSSNLGLFFTSMGAGSVVGGVFIIPRLRASLRQLKAAVEYGQVMPNIPQMGRFFSSMSGALQIATEGRAYHRRLMYASK
jgi:hypothetical protein